MAAIHWLGRVDYQSAVDDMEARRQRLLAGDDDAAAVLLLEHDPVITLGKSARSENLLVSPEHLRSRGIELHQVSRGGDITYHGPGQLVVYPILRIGIAVSDFLEKVAECLAEATRQLGVEGSRWQRQPAGLWHDGRKLAACGLHVRRGICIHGFAYNLHTPREAWSVMVPCGLAGFEVVSLAELLRGPCPSVGEFADTLAPILARGLASYGVTRS